MSFPERDLEIERRIRDRRAARRQAELRKLYRQRRIGALVILISLVGGTVVAANAMLGGASAPTTRSPARVTPNPARGGPTNRTGRQSPLDQARAGRKRRVHHLELPAHPPDRTVRLPILTYHRVHLLEPAAGPLLTDLTVDPENFAAQLDALRSRGFTTITQERLFRALFAGGRLPRKPVMLTFDDGYVDDVKTILPMLRRRKMVGTFYVVTGKLGDPGLVNATEVRELDLAGMDVGAHSRGHGDLTVGEPDAIRNEVRGSVRDLSRVLGHPVYFFSYPGGSFDERVVREARRARVVLAVTTRPGVEQSARAPLTLSRVRVRSSMGPEDVLRLAAARD